MFGPRPYQDNLETKGVHRSKFQTESAACIIVVCILVVLPAYAWGYEGREIIGLIAEHHLTPDERQKVVAEQLSKAGVRLA